MMRHEEREDIVKAGENFSDLADEELSRMLTGIGAHTGVGIGAATELIRRAIIRFTASSEQYSRRIVWLTWALVFLTGVLVLLTGVMAIPVLREVGLLASMKG